MTCPLCEDEVPMILDEDIFADAKDCGMIVSFDLPDDAKICGLWSHTTGTGDERSTRIGWLVAPKGYVEMITCKVTF